jgi:hypothetical protein
MSIFVFALKCSICMRIEISVWVTSSGAFFQLCVVIVRLFSFRFFVSLLYACVLLFRQLRVPIICSQGECMLLPPCRVFLAMNNICCGSVLQLVVHELEQHFRHSACHVLHPY